MTIRLAVHKGLVSLIVLAASGVAAFPQNPTVLLNQSNIAFTGTVVRLGASSFAQAPASPRTIVVRVDAILKKPAAVSLHNADEVTVEVKDPANFHDNDRLTFYTDGWIFGSGVAVKEVGHIAPSAAEAASPAAADQAEKEAADQKLKENVDAADAAVVGRVLSVEPWSGPTLMGPAPLHVSEHDPDWKEALVQVQSTIKGADNNQVVVRFPSSRDVAWVSSPKLHVGQTAIFVLKEDHISGSPRALLGTAQVTAYTALTEADVLPSTEAARVRALVGK